MAKDDKPLSPLEELERRHLKESGERRTGIDAAMAELRDIDKMKLEATGKVRELQQAHMNASFAYDAARQELE